MRSYWVRCVLVAASRMISNRLLIKNKNPPRTITTLLCALAGTLAICHGTASLWYFTRWNSPRPCLIETVGADIAGEVTKHLSLCQVAALMRTSKTVSNMFKAAFGHKLNTVTVTLDGCEVGVGDVQPENRASVFIFSILTGKAQAMVAMYKLGFVRVVEDPARAPPSTPTGYRHSMLANLLASLKTVKSYLDNARADITHGHKYHEDVCKTVEAMITVFRDQIVYELSMDRESHNELKATTSRIRRVCPDKPRYRKLMLEINRLLDL